MKRIGHISEIEGNLRGNIIIVGAGKDGKTLGKYLSTKNITVKCYVDESQARAGKSYDNITVVTPELCEVKNGDIIIICIGALAYLSDEQISDCSVVANIKRNDNELFIIDKTIRNESVILNHLHQSGVNIDKDAITIQNLTLPNYFRMSDNIRRTFVEEAADLILPIYFDEWSLVDEGPYAEIAGGGACY